MADHIAGFVVTLTRNVSDDEARKIVAALRMVKGVVGVKPVESSLEMAIAESRVNTAWINALSALALNPPTGGSGA